MKHDEPFDRLLGRTSRLADEAHATGACLDAQTVAAWTEGTLTAAERAAAEAHAADCSRCLAVLASMARISPPASAVQRPAWLSVRWLVPLATAAVAVIAWVFVQQPPSSERELSRVEQPAADAGAAAAAPPAEPMPRNRADALQKKPDAPARSNAKEQDELRDADTATARKPAAGTDRLGALAGQRPAEPPPAATAAPTTPPAAAPPPAPPAAAAPSAAPPAAAAESTAKESRRELKDQRFEAQARALARAAAIVSPDPNVLWRLSGRVAERSTDAGRTWQTQTTGADADLLAGAAPSPTVCWIVGRRGLVLVSTDGATWRRLDFPDRSADLVGVTATSALSASVTTAGRRTYRTSDGGLTWTLQENPAAPF